MAMHKFQLEDVLRYDGVEFRGGTRTIRTYCPFCSGKKVNKNFSVSFDTEKFNCFSCGVSGRGAITFHSLLHNITTKEAYADLCDKFGYTNNCSEPVKRERTVTHYEVAEESNEASPEVKNRTYLMMLENMKLSDKHRTDLIARGFNDLEINTLGYVTYPSMKEKGITQEYFNIPKKLLEYDCTLAGVPGFYKTKNKGVWALCKRKEGIVVPYHSFHNEIVCMQLRKNDDELLRDEETGEVENKYSWISSSGYQEGCKASTAVHYACDFAWDQGKKEFYPMIPNHKILLTEGAMKGDLTHAISGMPLMCLPGVSSANEAIKADIPLLKSIGVDTIVNAYDMDRVMNIHVAEALHKIKGIIEQGGLKTEELYWSNEMVSLQGEHFKMNVKDTFVFTPETLKSALEAESKDRQVPGLLQRIKKIDKTKVIFAIPDSKAITEEVKKNCSVLIESCKKDGIPCMPAFWSLKLKGIDDYFAHNKRGVSYSEK